MTRIRRARQTATYRPFVPEAETEPAGTPTVPYVVTRCPFCGSGDSKIDGRHQLADGVVRYHLCRGCGRKFRSVEDPDPGAPPD